MAGDQVVAALARRDDSASSLKNEASVSYKPRLASSSGAQLGEKHMNVKPVLLIAALSLLAPSAFANEAIAKKAGCMACHMIDKKMVGPAYKAVADKYRAQADAADKLAAKVRKGGKDVWGPIPMPPNPDSKISDADLASVIQWILKI
jgi:cytochrome c